MTLIDVDPAALRDAALASPIHRMLALMGGSTQTIDFSSPACGFLIGGLNTHQLAVAADEFPELHEGLHCYGVVDSPEQFRDRYASQLDADDRSFVVFFTAINKSDQPDEGGWRWHKHGEYIGDKNPQCEYLYDENDSIHRVYSYRVVEVAL
jgi:hypothetical protein